MSRVLRLLSDWSLWPFYVDLGDGDGYRMTDPDTLRETFALPERVVRAALDWDELYQRVLDWNDPPSTPWARLDESKYVERGRRVCRLLRAHLPPDVGIDYRADGEIPPERY
jgi:hypothetical protein